VSALLIAACGSSSPSTADYSGKTVALGAVLSLTGAGSVFGPQQKQAIDLAVEDLNRTGVAGGRVSVDIQDDASDPATAASAAKKLIADKHVLGLVGPTLTIAATAMHQVAQSGRTPVIAPSETGPHIVGDCSGSGDCPYVFRDSLGEAVAIPAGVKAAVARTHPKTAAIVYCGDYVPSVQALSTFKQAFADNGVTVADSGAVSFSKHDTDFTAAITAAKAVKADIWALSGPSTTPGSVLAAARSQGYDGPVLGDDTFNSYTVSAAAGKAGKGAFSASAYWPGSPDPTNKTFVSEYQARFKDANGKAQTPDEVAAQSYSAVLILAQAARQANLGFTNPAGDRDAMRTALERVSLATPLGSFSFTAAHDARQTVWINAMDGAGGFINLTSISG